MTHTPGPWIVQHFNDEPTACICADEGALRIATMEHGTLADSDLIAAAPELLEALKNALNILAGIAVGDLKTVKADSPAIALCRKAIAKAEGKG